jgi:hypothetical protein
MYNMKRSRDQISWDLSRNVKAKRDAEENIAKLEQEYKSHPDTILEKLPESLHPLVKEDRLTSLEINHTLHNYGYARIQTWICRFVLDSKVYTCILGRSIMKGGDATWGGLSSIHPLNKKFFEEISCKEATACQPFDINNLRTKILSGEPLSDPTNPTNPTDMWQWALKTQYDDEPKAITLLIHLNQNPSDDFPMWPESPPKSNPVPAKLEGFELLSLPSSFGKEESEE